MRRQPGLPLLLLLILVGAAIGGLLGEVLAPYWAVLGEYYHLGFTPTTVNLGALEFTAGLSLRFNPVSIIGVIMAIFVFRRW